MDISEQAQALNLLKNPQLRFDLSLISITNDLSVVQHITDKVAVIYLGKFVEEGTLDEGLIIPRIPMLGAYYQHDLHSILIHKQEELS